MESGMFVEQVWLGFSIQLQYVNWFQKYATSISTKQQRYIDNYLVFFVYVWVGVGGEERVTKMV